VKSADIFDSPVQMVVASMSYEYRIRFSTPSNSDLDHAIRDLPFFGYYDENHRTYNLWLRPMDKRLGMPDAHAILEEAGIYFCRNGGPEVDRIKESLLAIAKRHDPDTSIEEL